VRSSHHAAIAEDKARIDRIENFGVRDRIDLVQSKNFAVSAYANLITASENVQNADSGMLTNRELFYKREYIEVTDGNVVTYLTFIRIKDRKPDANVSTDLVAKERPEAASRKRARQDADDGEHCESQFSHSIQGYYFPIQGLPFHLLEARIKQRLQKIFKHSIKERLRLSSPIFESWCMMLLTN